MSGKQPPVAPGNRQLPEAAFSFDDEATVAMRGTVFSDEPTEPLGIQEDVGDAWSVPTGSEASDGAPTRTEPGVVQRMIAEVDRLKLLAGTRGARITPELTRALAVGVTQTGGGLLSPVQAIAAAQGMMAMAEDHYARAVKLFRQAGVDEAGAPIPGADADAERALLLRAIAERRSHLENGAIAQLLRLLGIQVGSDRKLSEIIAFADEIRGRSGIRSRSDQG